MNIRVFLLLCIFYVGGYENVFADFFRLYSPDHRVAWGISIEEGKLKYTVAYDGREVVAASQVRWRIGKDTLGDRCTGLRPVKTFKKKLDYETRGAHSRTKNTYHCAIYDVDNGELSFRIEVWVAGNGVAFRYLAGQGGEVDDFTTFSLPVGKALWAQNSIGFYEGAYRKYLSGNLQEGQLAGPPVTVKCDENLYALISEAGLRDFAGMALQAVDPQTFRVRLDGVARCEGEVDTPWRVVMIGDLNSLVNNDIITDVSAPEAEVFRNNKDWIVPGKSVWSWLAKYPVTIANMKLFSDWAAELGVDYNLVDEGWSHWGKTEEESWQKLKEVVDYAKEKGVKTFIWKAYPDRKGIAGIQTPERRKAFFEKCRHIGVAGVKIDFFDRETQEVVRYQTQTLEEAARYRLMVNFHGCAKPTGLSRTYPNEVAREGILGLEYGSAWQDQNTVTPFTRFVVGHADYTPFTFMKNMMGETTQAHQIATLVVMDSPFLCYGGNPKEYLEHPAREFFMSIPTVWDESVVLDVSEIGDVVAIARRSGKKWFLAVISEHAKTIELPLDFLGKGNYSYTCVADVEGNQHHVEQGNGIAVKTDTIKINLSKAGGYVASFTR